MTYDAAQDAEQLALELARLDADAWPVYLAMALQRVFSQGYRQAIGDRK